MLMGDCVRAPPPLTEGSHLMKGEDVGTLLHHRRLLLH